MRGLYGPIYGFITITLNVSPYYLYALPVRLYFEKIFVDVYLYGAHSRIYINRNLVDKWYIVLSRAPCLREAYA